jgi:hypothetical protein
MLTYTHKTAFLLPNPAFRQQICFNQWQPSNTVKERR